MKKIFWIIALLLLGLAGALGFLSLKSRFFIKNEPIIESLNQKTEVFLTSPYKQLSLYEKAFASVEKKEKKLVSAGITSHHFLAKNFIADFFQGIDKNNIQRVILISPDHFNYSINDQTLAHSSLLNWQTAFSILKSDQDLIEKLYEQSLITLKDTGFRNEHGIYTLVPFIKYSFPQASILPLILNPKKTDLEFFSFGQTLKQELDSSSTLLIVSSDFSHGLSLEKTQQADLQSIETLEKLSLENLRKVNCDCPACLAFLLGYLDGGDYQLELIDNKNSADFSEKNQETVTSYVNAYFLP